MNDGPIKVAPKQWAIQEARSKPKRGKASCKPSNKAGRSQVAPIRKPNRSAGKAASSE